MQGHFETNEKPIQDWMETDSRTPQKPFLIENSPIIKRDIRDRYSQYHTENNINW